MVWHAMRIEDKSCLKKITTVEFFGRQKKRSYATRPEGSQAEKEDIGDGKKWKRKIHCG